MLHRLLFVLALALAAGSLTTSPADAGDPRELRDLGVAITLQRAPRINGEASWTHTLRAGPGRYSPTPTSISYQWLRSGRAIRGARSRSHPITPEDLGARLEVRVTVEAPGYEPLQTVSRPTAAVAHRIGVRRVVTYSVATRGQITTSLQEFAELAAATYDDPRGWRDAGIEFRSVATGGSFTLVLAQASLVPGFSSACSATWSCRVGRYVIINQDRWRNASPAWNLAHLALRDYRHLVVNHETGHWLGLGHAGCPGPGRRAPVMMQQSKGVQGCRFNPFPTAHEIAIRTPRGPPIAKMAPHD